MFTTTRLVVLTLAALAGLAGGANARERTSAPIEFASRAARPTVVSATAQTAASTPARRAAATSLDTPEMLYGYGRAARSNNGSLLDLRGTLRAGGSTTLLDSDAFDDVAPATTEAAPVVMAAAVSLPEPSTVQPASGAFFVQIGAFADPANAERVRTALLDVGAVSVDVREGPSVTLHRVRLGQWQSREEAELARDLIVERGFAGAVVSSVR